MRCQAGPGGERKDSAVAVAEDDVSSRRQPDGGGMGGGGEARVPGAQDEEEQQEREDGKASEGEADEESRVVRGLGSQTLNSPPGAPVPRASSFLGCFVCACPFPGAGQQVTHVQEPELDSRMEHRSKELAWGMHTYIHMQREERCRD